MRSYINAKFLFVFSLFFVVLTSFSANAQEARIPSTCLAVAQNNFTPQSKILQASFKKSNIIANNLIQAQANFPEVTLQYLGHSTYRITSPEGLVIETDFSNILSPQSPPDVITMNHAHNSHWTSSVPKEISIILKGWNEDFGKPAEHYLSVSDVLIRNVPTDIYRGGVLLETNGNSIFIFETAGLCIGHLGHMHHKLTPELIAKIGRLDIVMMPVDGRVTLSTQAMVEMAKTLRSSIILPMHWFSTYGLQEFMAQMSSGFALSAYPTNLLKVSLNKLPKTPTVVHMTPLYGSSNSYDE